MKHVLSAIIWLVIACSVSAQEIKLFGPEAPIEVNDLQEILVTGITHAEFLQSSIVVNPGTAKAVHGSYAGMSAVFFRAAKNNSYTVTVGQNVQHLEWQIPLGLTLQKATDVNLTGEIFERLKKLAVDAAVAFPSRGGSCVVVVGPPGPQPPPIPPPPAPDDPSAQLQTLVAPIREALKANPAKAEKLKNIYAGLRDVVKQDAGLKIKDTASLQKLHADTLDQIRATEPPLVGAQIDDAIASYLVIAKTAQGFAVKALSPADVAKFAELCNAISWASGKAAMNQ